MMRWWSSIVNGRSRSGWTRVSIVDDQHESETDELMRMALGQYPEDNENRSSEVVRNDDPSGSDPGAPVFHHAQRHSYLPWSLLSAPSSAPLLQESNPEEVSFEDAPIESETTCNVSCSRCLPKLAFPHRRWVLVLLSIFVAIAFIGLTVGLGIYSLMFYKPDKLVIDKSVKSFSIPNHKAYKNFEAMMLARKNSTSRGRVKRDTEGRDRWKRDALFAKESEMLRQTDTVLRELKLEDTGFMRRKKRAASSSLWSLNSESGEPSSGGFSIGTTFNKLLQRIKRSSRQINCLFEYQSNTRWRMHVIYLAHGDDKTNMFTKERLQTAHDIENQIVQHPRFHDFCLRDPRRENDPAIRKMNGCVPLNSLLTYFYPSQDSNGNVFYDGQGKNIADIDSALKLAMNHETFYYFVDDKINKTYQKSHLMRSEVLFGAPLKGFSCVGGERKDQDEEFKDFVVTYINLLSKSSTDKVKVLYGGNEIFDYEVQTSFWSDVRLAVISLIAIFVLMLLLSLSLYLTIVGVVVIAITFPISLFFYRVAFRINALGILNGAAAFVIIGIGVDDVFVFVNIYRQAAHMKDPLTRILYTVKTAGVATFFTSFTTAAAFAASISSSIPAVYEFGLFMALVVSSCWISVFVLMPPMLYLHACFFEPIENFIFSCFSCVKPGVRSNHYDSSVHHYSEQQASDHRLYHDDDVPMLDIELEEPCTNIIDDDDDDGMDDDNMLLIDDPYSDRTDGTSPSAAQEEDQTDVSGSDSTFVDNSSYNNMCLGRFIQKLLMFLTNRIVIRGRFIIVAFYAAVLITSCALMAHLQPSTHPPQLFRPDTNLQQLLDLKANFTIIEAINCDKCSGYYKVKPTRARDIIDAETSWSKQPPLTAAPPVLNRPHHGTGITDNHSLSTHTSHPGQRSSHNTENVDGNQHEHSKSLSEVISSFAEQTHSVPLKLLGASLAKLLSPLSSTSSSSSADRHYTNQSTTKDTADHETEPTPEDRVKSSQATPPTLPPPPPTLPPTPPPLQHKTTTTEAVSPPGEISHQNAIPSNPAQTPSTIQKPEDKRPGPYINLLEPTKVPTNIIVAPTITLRRPPSLSSFTTSNKSDEISDGSHNQVKKEGYKPFQQDWLPSSKTSKTSSVDENFNACKGQSCNHLKDRPLLDSGATVYVVFGVKGVDRAGEEEGHVLDQFKGRAIFDSKFAEAFDLKKSFSRDHLSELCKVCKVLANRTDLVKEGSAQCLPYRMSSLQGILNDIPECRDMPQYKFVLDHQAPAHAEFGVDSQRRLLWLAFAFESTTSEGQAYFEAYKAYEKWEKLITHIKHHVLSPDSPLETIFQTSEFWTKVLMEIVAVDSAIYGLVLSMIICIMAVAVFTGHLVLLFIVVATIIAMICCVVGIFYLAGWEMGAVEAVSLSILVGSSVDYCVHIVEGFILIGRRMPKEYVETQPKGALRRQRTSMAVRHIGVAIVCSALTTIIAAVPLTQTYIQPFAKFGSILLINTTVSMVMTLTLAVALLAICGPARYRDTLRSHLIAAGVVILVVGLTVLTLYIVSTQGVTIPGPSGNPLFS